MTRYRITENRAPQGSAGIQPADWATDSKRGTIRLALLCAGLFCAAMMAGIAGGVL